MNIEERRADKISIIVPCYNEEACIEIVYAETAAAMEALTEKEQVSYEIIFVDDGSRDGTLKALRELAASHTREAAQVRYLSFSRNFGKEAAMLAGLREATGDYLVLMDADLQHPPTLLPRMYRILRDSGGALDLCGARRRGRAGEGKIRACLSRGFYKVWNRLTGMETASGEGDFRMMRRCVVDAILQLGECNRYTKGIFAYVGFRTSWIEYENVARSIGESKWNLRGLLRYAAQGIFAFSDAPLKIAGPLGTGLVFLGVLTLLLPQTRHVIICLPLLLSGLQLLVLQAIGSYLARAYWEIKQRPVYIVRERSLDTGFSDKQREFSPPSRGGKYSGPSPVFQYSDGHRIHSCGADR